MWIESTNNGKFKACERYKDPLTGKLRKVSVTLEKDSRQSRKLALAALAEKIEQARKKTAADDVTLEEACHRYIAFQKASGIRKSTYARNENVLGCVMEILGKDALLSNLQSKFIKERLLKSGKQNTTLNGYLTRFKAMIRWAHKEDYLEDISFIDRLDPFPELSAREKIVDKFLEKEELSKLVDGMAVERWKLVTQFLALSGLRIGELIALDNSDVGSVISVTKTYSLSTLTLENNTKTYASTREVFVQPELMSIVQKIRQFVLEDQMKAGYRSSLFFPSPSGYLHYDSYRIYLEENSRRIIGRPVTPHTLRHTHVSLLAEQGVPLDVIARRVGHEDSDITRKIYFHVTEKLKEKDNEMISKISFF